MIVVVFSMPYAGGVQVLELIRAGMRAVGEPFTDHRTDEVEDAVQRHDPSTGSLLLSTTAQPTPLLREWSYRGRFATVVCQRPARESQAALIQNGVEASSAPAIAEWAERKAEEWADGWHAAVISFDEVSVNPEPAASKLASLLRIDREALLSSPAAAIDATAPVLPATVGADLCESEFMVKATERLPGNTVHYITNISLKHNYVYVETAKTGCTSIKALLYAVEMADSGLAPPRHVHHVLARPLVAPFQLPPETLDRMLLGAGTFRFAFVRNPYTRVLSAYLDKIVRGRDEKASILRTLGRDPEDLAQPVSFTEFLTAIERQEPKERNIHFGVQSHQTLHGLVPFDFVGRFERLDEDVAALQQAIPALRRARFRAADAHRTNAGEHVRAYYDRIAVRLVRRIYEADFEIYGYDRELPG